MSDVPPGPFAARVEVALPVPIDSTFTYGVPSALAASAQPGHRVLVPFRRRNLTGLVVTVGPADSPRSGPTLRPILKVMDESPVIGPGMIRILCEAAREVFCPVGIALATALPAGSTPRSARGFVLTPRGREALSRGAVVPDARPLLQALSNAPRTERGLAQRFPRCGRLLRTLQRDGLITPAIIQGRQASPPSERVASLTEQLDVEATIAGPLARAPKQAAVLRALACRGALTTGALEQLVPGSAQPLRALARRGLASVVSRTRSPAGPPEALGREASVPPPLTEEQRASFDTVAEAIRQRRPERFLLHGVTGSGKTEVYLRSIDAALQEGRQVLVLVPEITLTHQLLARLRARFGDRVAVLHSALRPGERIGEWRRLLGGGTPIAVGARSALFAPLDDLGLVVIDEEHEPAYKNEEGFRYHARDLAARLAKAAPCPMVLGSATPSLETRAAAEQGTVRRLVLPHRIGGRPLPAVEIVDLEAERAALPRGRKLVLSRSLAQALRETLADGAQAILFLNRRGFSTRIFCFDCGHAERCRHCDISLVYHATDQCLRCHYCDFRIDPPERCSNCGAPETALLGLGTQRLEEEVRRRFPDARIARLDRDSAGRRGETEQVLGALVGGQVDVLIGTQMVAKGHDFPGVRLVGVIAADLGLHLPDFRAAERTFQLLTQVAGRAGRGAAPGRVILQTFVPDHYAIRPVRTHDYEAFYREEIQHRAALAYPPFGRLVLVLVTSRDLGAAEATASRLAELARRHAGASVPPESGAASIEVLGPAPAPIPRLRDRHRVQLLVKGGAIDRVLEVGRRVARAAAEMGVDGVRVQVDPNPVNLL